MPREEILEEDIWRGNGPEFNFGYIEPLLASGYPNARKCEELKKLGLRISVLVYRVQTELTAVDLGKIAYQKVTKWYKAVSHPKSH